MTEHSYVIVTEDGEILESGLTLTQAEFALCRHINLGAEDAYIGEDNQTPTPLGGLPEKNPNACRCEEQSHSQDCGCAFGQCAKGLIY
jgi:hypothetical protein